MISMIVYFSG